MKNHLTFALLLAASCATTTPPGPPDVVATQVIEHIDAGQAQRASELFEKVGRDERYTEQVYPVLFDTARERYEAGNLSGAAGLLRFLSSHYPQGQAAQEALLNTLFLQRSNGVSSAELAGEIETLATLLRERAPSGTATPWVELVAAQQAIDQNRLPKARTSLESFLETWNGEPGDEELFLYVENMARYLESH